MKQTALFIDVQILYMLKEMLIALKKMKKRNPSSILTHSYLSVVEAPIGGAGGAGGP